MTVDGTMIAVLAIVFFATLIRSVFGFGEALVAVPLLAFVIPIEEAAPLATLVSITVAALVIAQDWRHVHFLSASWLVVSTLAGIPLGLLLLTLVAEPVVKAVLGALIIGFSIFCLRKPGRAEAELTNDRWAWAFGFVAGVLGGAYGMNGPPLVVYGSLRKWSPAHFRATLQGYFLPASLVGMTGYWLAGLWTPAVTRLYLVSLPVTLAAVVLGRAIHRRIQAESFLRFVHGALLLVGTGLLVQSLAK